jgi:DNA-binding LytR/AlgR family response regulator
VLVRFWGLDSDGRNWNLFATIRNDSFILNMLIFIVSISILFVWQFAERNQLLGYKIHMLEFSLEGRRPAKSMISSITVKNGYKNVVFRLEQIVCLEANGPYVKIITETGAHLLSGRVYDWQRKLPANFLRVHRSHIVNVSFVSEIKSLLNGDHRILLKNQQEIPSSRTYKKNMRSILEENKRFI